MGKTLFTIKLKSRTEIEKSIRKTWAFMPASKSFKSKRDYNRFQAKRSLEKALKNGDY